MSYYFSGHHGGESGLRKEEATLFVYLMRQDDPKKCTSTKMFRFNRATPIPRPSMIPRLCIVLNPYAAHLLSPADRDTAITHGICAVDCSWEKASSVFKRRFSSNERRLPILLAANPTHYAHRGILSSVEALAGALIIIGLREQATRILSLFKWGPAFLTLNREPLRDYAAAKNPLEVEEAERDYF
jgi:pre-rRNA-processing protein TSR3